MEITTENFGFFKYVVYAQSQLHRNISIKQYMCDCMCVYLPNDNVMGLSYAHSVLSPYLHLFSIFLNCKQYYQSLPAQYVYENVGMW